MHAENTEIVTVPRTYWSQDWIGHQNLSLGDQDLGRIDQGTRLSDFEDFNPLESLSTPIFRLPYRKFKAIIVIQEKRPSPKKKKKNQKPYRKVFVFIKKISLFKFLCNVYIPYSRHYPPLLFSSSSPKLLS